MIDPKSVGQTHRPVGNIGFRSVPYGLLAPFSFHQVLLCVLAMLLVSLSLCCSRSPSCQYRDKIKIRLKWYHQAQFAGFYVAKAKGFFADEGLDVDLEEGTTYTPSIQMVASGKDQFGVAAAEDIVIARYDKIPIKAVFVVFQETPFCLMVRKETGIQFLKDLKGKTVGVQPGNHEVVTYRAMLRAANMSESDIEPVAVGDSPKDMMAKFIQQGSVTAWPSYSINEPIALELKGIQTTTISPKDYNVQIYGDTLFTTDRMISDYPCVVNKLVKAVRRGWEYARNHQEEAVNLTMQQNPALDRKLQERMLTTELTYLGGPGSLGTMSDNSWFQIYDMLVQSKFIGVDQDFRKAYTIQFLNQ